MPAGRHERARLSRAEGRPAEALLESTAATPHSLILLTLSDQVVVALDFNRIESALGVVNRLGDRVGTYKVGLELLTATGPGVVSTLIKAEKTVCST